MNNKGNSTFSRKLKQSMGIRTLYGYMHIAEGQTCSALPTRHIVAKLKLAHNGIIAGSYLLFGLANKTIFSPHPVIIGAAVAREKEKSWIRVYYFMYVITPPVTSLLFTDPACLVSVKGDQGYTDFIHNPNGIFEISLSIPALSLIHI